MSEKDVDKYCNRVLNPMRPYQIGTSQGDADLFFFFSSHFIFLLAFNFHFSILSLFLLQTLSFLFLIPLSHFFFSFISLSNLTGPDIFFQALERANPYYAAVPKAVEQLAPVLGKRYGLFEYVVVIMGSGAQAAEECIESMKGREKRLAS